MQNVKLTFQLARPLVFVDTEWTDTHPEDRRLVSIAITRIEPDGAQSSGYWLVNPQRPISPQATQIHGITMHDVASQPGFRQVAHEIEALLKDADIAGYSVTNDIERELRTR